MAGRHYFPLIAEADIGPDPDAAVPMFPALEPVRYKAGMDPVQLVRKLAGKERVALEAPACARKSVDVPAAILRGGQSALVVHCVPNRLLAVDTHDYVRTLHEDVSCHAVMDYDGPQSFPSSGLVFTSSSILVAYMAAWRAHAVPIEFTLFLDEMHESDFATATLRKLQTTAPGVRLYIEATATRGTGGGQSNFVKPTLPGEVIDRTFVPQPPEEWDLYERAKPWSLLSTSGDIMIFEDNPKDARLICSKFAEVGARAYRLHAKMDVEDFRRTMALVRNPPKGEGIAVIVVDYSFRSGFSFKTVTRIIDPGLVEYVQMERGRVVVKKRKAFASEVYQARNRGGRFPGIVCDYWSGVERPETVNVYLEGVEVDLACLAFRMLGRVPDRTLAHSPFSKGLVPRQFNHVMRGNNPVRTYKLDQPWPGESRAPQTPPPVSPMEANFPETPESAVADDGASVFTVDDATSSQTGSITAEQYDRLRSMRRSHVRERPKERLEDAPPVPRLDEQPADAFDDAFAKLSGGRGHDTMVFGQYYYAAGLDVSACQVYRSFDEVLQGVGTLPYAAYVRSLRGRSLHDACAQALFAYNDAVARATAANYVVSYAAGSDVIRRNTPEGALADWARQVRAEYTNATTVGRTALEFLMVGSRYTYHKMRPMEERESQVAAELINLLSVKMHDDDIEQEYRAGLPEVAFNPSGRYQLEIQPTGWRSRLALACLGKQPGYINLAVGPGDPGGSQPVYTSASEIARASTYR